MNKKQSLTELTVLQMQTGFKITCISVLLFQTFFSFYYLPDMKLKVIFNSELLCHLRLITITKLVACTKYPLIKEKWVIVRLMLREERVYGSESPSLCIITTWTFSYILHTSYRDLWWHQAKSSYQWSTASAKGKRGPFLAGTLVMPAGHPWACGTGD